MVLFSGSPAQDSGDDGLLLAPFGVTSDQRGFPRIRGAHVDIGAFESQGISSPPILAGTALQGSTEFQIRFSSMPGATFTVLRTTNANSPLINWTELGPANITGPGQFEFIDAISGEGVYFYRVRSP